MKSSQLERWFFWKLGKLIRAMHTSFRRPFLSSNRRSKEKKIIIKAFRDQRLLKLQKMDSVTGIFRGKVKYVINFILCEFDLELDLLHVIY